MMLRRRERVVARGKTSSYWQLARPMYHTFSLTTSRMIAGHTVTSVNAQSLIQRLSCVVKQSIPTSAFPQVLMCFEIIFQL